MSYVSSINSDSYLNKYYYNSTIKNNVKNDTKENTAVDSTVKKDESETTNRRKTLDEMFDEINNTANNIGTTFNSIGNQSSNINLFQNSDNEKNNYFNNLSSLAFNYATIRSGAFYNALKNYYNNTNNKIDSTSETSDKISDSKLQSAYLSGLKDNLSNINSAENSVRLAINDAKNSESLNAIMGSTDKSYMDKLVNKVSDFVNSYNNMIDSTKNIDSTKTLSNVLLMTKTTRYNSETLSDIGITIGSDNKLSLDKDKLKNADMDKIESAFGHNSYGEYIGEKSSSLSSLCTSEIKSAKHLEILAGLTGYKKSYEGSYVDKYY